MEMSPVCRLQSVEREVNGNAGAASMSVLQFLRQMARPWTCEPRNQPGPPPLPVENVTAWELRRTKYRNKNTVRGKKKKAPCDAFKNWY